MLDKKSGIKSATIPVLGIYLESEGSVEQQKETLTRAETLDVDDTNVLIPAWFLLSPSGLTLFASWHHLGRDRSSEIVLCWGE